MHKTAGRKNGDKVYSEPTAGKGKHGRTRESWQDQGNMAGSE